MSDNESMALSPTGSWRSQVEGPGVLFRRSLAALAAPYQRGSNWYLVRDDSISFPPARSGKGTEGPRSLVAMCLRVLADNIAASSEGWIQRLPDKLARALWKELSPRTMALDAWDRLGYNLMDKAYHDVYEPNTDQRVKRNEAAVPMAMYRYCQEVLNPPCSLSVYTDYLGEDLQHCLIYLCIDNVAQFETHELIPLATLWRLEVLELIEREPTNNGITDRLITAWSEAAGKEDVFSRLRVLKITSNTHAVSERSLHHVLQFPELEIFDITALPAQRWRKAEDIAEDYGWKVTEPKGSLFASYAEAYLDGLIKVNVKDMDVERLRSVFEDDRQRVVLMDDPRWPIYKEWQDQPLHARTKSRNPRGGNGPNLSGYLEDGWRALLQGTHPLSTTADTDTQGGTGSSNHRHQHLSDDEVFWFLALLDQNTKWFDDEDAPHIQAQAAGITLPRERFVSLRLRNPPSTPTQHSRAPMNSERLVFSRRREAAQRILLEHQRRREPPPLSWAPRADDRKVTDFKPRKRQRTTADLLSSFGMLSVKKSK